MRFIVGDYEIEVKAKSKYSKASRFSKEETMNFLNNVCIWMDEAAKYKNFENKNDSGYYTDKPEAIETSKACAGYLKRESDELFDQLKEAGAYDRL